MAKNYNEKRINKLLHMNVKKIYKHYLWINDRKEWWRITLNELLKKLKPIFVVIIFLLPLATAVTTLSDGTNSKEYISLRIKELQVILPKLENAYYDIDKLSNSISKIAYKDLDQSFIYAFLIYKWSLHYKLDPIEVAAIIQTESEFNPNAVSKKDARGLMQIHRPTWKMDNYFDSEKNIQIGAKILLMYKKSGGDYLSKYSGGEIGYTQKVEKNKKKILQGKS